MIGGIAQEWRKIFDIWRNKPKIYASMLQWHADFTSLRFSLTAGISGALPRLSPSHAGLTRQSITFVDSLPRRGSKLLS
jgi:hypothetical protein